MLQGQSALGNVSSCIDLLNNEGVDAEGKTSKVSFTYFIFTALLRQTDLSDV